MQSDRIKILDVKEKIVDQLNEYIDVWYEMLVFFGLCCSWYKNNMIDDKIFVWGGLVSCDCFVMSYFVSGD